jgi:hypothetical protein
MSRADAYHVSAIEFRPPMWYDALSMPVTALNGATYAPLLALRPRGAVAMSESRPDPLLTIPTKPRRLCPVCGIVSYSAGGTHPQCAEQQADASRVARLKKARKVAKLKVKVTNLNAVRAWHKRCPKCHAEVHIRKPACDCGHQFSRSGQ